MADAAGGEGTQENAENVQKAEEVTSSNKRQKVAEEEDKSGEGKVEGAEEAEAEKERKMLKKELRKAVAATLKTLDDKYVTEKSKALAERLAGIEKLKEAKNVSVYLSMQKEVQTGPILEWLFENGKNVYVPKVIGKTSDDMRMPKLVSMEELESLEKTKWGIPEFTKEQLVNRPDGLISDDSLIDVVLTPGVAFTERGERLGHGKGYYDCFLGKLQVRRMSFGLKPAYMIGLGLDEQLKETVPLSEHDVLLDAIVTPTTLYENKQSTLYSAEATTN